MTETSEHSKNILVIIRQAPYVNSLPAAALDIVLTAAAFDQQITLLFSGQGVWHLQPDQHAASTGMKAISRALPSLELYEVKRIVADAEALAARGLAADELLMPVALYSPRQIAAAISAADQVFNC